MSKKLRVTGKTVTTKKEGALVDRRSRDRVDASCGTQLNRGFDVTSRSFTCIARLNARLNQATDVIEMINDGL